MVMGKPDPMVYEFGTRRLNARPESVLVIEDVVPGVSEDNIDLHLIRRIEQKCENALILFCSQFRS